jgi:hypothetical protein
MVVGEIRSVLLGLLVFLALQVAGKACRPIAWPCGVINPTTNEPLTEVMVESWKLEISAKVREYMLVRRSWRHRLL